MTPRRRNKHTNTSEYTDYNSKEMLCDVLALPLQGDHKARQNPLNTAVKHYENTPIQIYWKFHHQKLKTISDKNSDIFHVSAQNIDCAEAVLTSTHKLCFWAEIRKIMYTPLNPSFIIWKWGLRGSKLYRHVFVMQWEGKLVYARWKHKLYRDAYPTSCTGYIWMTIKAIFIYLKQMTLLFKEHEQTS